MLNELYLAALALDRAGVKMGQEWHKNMRPFPKAKTVRLWLSKSGGIDRRVDVIDEVAALELRKYAPTKFFSVPAMNINYLTGYNEEDRGLEIDKVLKGLKLLAKQAEELKEKLAFESGTAWYELLNRLSSIDASLFRDEFEEVISKNSAGLSFAPNKAIHVIFDLLDYEEFGEWPIAHTESIRVLNDKLLSLEMQGEVSCQFDFGEMDIFGESKCGCDELIAEVTVPVLGGISVFSLNKDIPAQTRYGLISVGTCKLGGSSRKKIRASLEWLTQNERKGFTWGMLEAKSLALAFAMEVPQRKIPLTRLFGVHADVNDVGAQLSFEDQAESVVSLLKGKGGAAKSNVALVILRKMDLKRVKVICDRVVSVETLEMRSNEWAEGFANVPVVSVREWPLGKKEGENKPRGVVSKSVLPLRFHHVINEVYKQSGELVDPIPGYSAADDAALFLENDSAGLAFGMMEQYMRCSRGYFLTLCRELCVKDSKGFRAITQMRNPGEHLGVLGLLLKKLNINKENYMKGTPYELGRFLRIADELHTLYCELVRKNDIPNELCGSSLLLAAMENPVSALQQLAMRSGPYVKWSQTYHDENKVGLVRYWRRHWSEIADRLAENDLPKHLAAAEQAQLFLGFLSSFQKSGNDEDAIVNNETEKENQ